VRADGAVGYGAKTGWATLSAHASNADITHIAFASGIMYATKNTASTFTGGTTGAQLGCFSITSPTTWSAMTPSVMANINAIGTTFGLVAAGNYVYWGVSNGMVTKVYKALSAGGTVDDVLYEVAAFPTGFVGACMYSYLGTVYIGGHFDAATPDTGIGAIYALVSDSPVLLTEIGSDKTLDNRVLAMTAYERNLYFVSNTHIWRWDLKYGGYSHWAGPLNSNAVTLYEDLTWVGTWDMAAAPGTGAEPDTTISLNGDAALTYDGSVKATMTASSQANYATIKALANSAAGGTNNILDSTGTTMEIDVTDNCLWAFRGGVYGGAIHFGINGSEKVAWARLVLDPADGYAFVHCHLYSGTGHTTSDTLIESAVGFPVGTGSRTYTVRLTLKDGMARLYVISDAGTTTEVCSGKVKVTPGTAKQTWLKFMRSYAQGTVTDHTMYRGTQHADVARVRWCDDGAYSPDVPTAVSTVQLACFRDKVVAACSGYSCAVTGSGYFVPGDDQMPPSLTLSQTSGNMPTVDKYFHSFDVQLQNALPDACSLALSGTVDGKTFIAAENTAKSDQTLRVFDLGFVGRSLQPVLSLITSDGDYTPVVTDHSILFTPMPKTYKNWTYYVRCWEHVESRSPGQKWDEQPEVVIPWLEGLANTVITVERPYGDSYQGKVEGIEFLEASPSGKATGREGLYQLTVKEVG
jgi:hypothetical protein